MILATNTLQINWILFCKKIYIFIIHVQSESFSEDKFETNFWPSHFGDPSPGPLTIRFFPPNLFCVNGPQLSYIKKIRNPWFLTPPECVARVKLININGHHWQKSFTNLYAPLPNWDLKGKPLLEKLIRTSCSIASTWKCFHYELATLPNLLRLSGNQAIKAESNTFW